LISSRFQAPQGTFRFGAHQNVIFPVYIREVKRVNGRLRNVVTEKVLNVDQFWDSDYMGIQKVQPAGE